MIGRMLEEYIVIVQCNFLMLSPRTRVEVVLLCCCCTAWQLLALSSEATPILTATATTRVDVVME